MHNNCWNMFKDKATVEEKQVLRRLRCSIQDVWKPRNEDRYGRS